MASPAAGFSPVPGSQTTSPTDIDVPFPPKPVRRVYGRAKPRPASPVSSAVIPSTPSSVLADHTGISVAKFEAQQQKWLQTFSSFGSKPLHEDEATDEEIGDEEALQYMSALRSGKDSVVVPGFGSSSELTALASSSARQPAIVPPSAPKAKQLPAFDSDSSVLTALPPTTDPLSPPINIELAGPSKSHPLPLRATQSSPTPSHHVDLPVEEETLFPPKKISTAKARIVESSDEDDDLPPIKSTYKGKSKLILEDDDDDELTPGPSRHNKPRLSDEDNSDSSTKRLNRRQPSADAPARRRKAMAATAPTKSGAAELVMTLFGDDEHESLPSTSGKREKTLKPLPKKELNEMRKDMSRAKREREAVGITRIVKDVYPISSFIANATAKVNSASSSFKAEAKHEQPKDGGTPSLSQASIDHTSSPSIPTPLDDITSFSSVVMDKDSTNRYDRVDSSPSVKLGKKLHFVDHVDNSVRPSDRKVPLAKRAVGEENRGDLQARKQKAAAAALRQAQAKQDDSDSDDLEIVKETPKKVTKARAPPKAGPAPKSRELANLHLLAGIRGSGLRADMSESHWEHAGKAFAHADTKVKQGARAQQGVSARKNEAVGLNDMNRYLFEKDRLSSAKMQKAKEDAWGTRRVLADKEALDLSLAAQTGDAPDEMEEEDGGEDGDYVPEGSGSEAAEESEAEADIDKRPVYSGEEDNEMEEGEGGVSDVDEDDKENQPPAIDSEDEQTPLARPVRARKVFRSPSASPSAPLAPLPVPGSPTPQSAQSSPGGFGSEDGGFSQLFGETQVDNHSGDGFAALRQQNAAPLLPAHMLLPANHISATQMERDNAMVAAEADVEARMAATTEEESQPRYLNKQGFFTQTHPSETEETQPQAMIYPTFTESLEPASLSGPAYTATYVSPEKRPLATQVDSPIQLRRLKRRRTGSLSSDRGGDAPSVSPPLEFSPVKSNAFDILHAGAIRQQRAADRSAERAHRAGFVDEEAEQSDEEDAWGTVRKDKDDDDEEDEEDGFVPDLVNDAARSAAQEEADKVARDAKRRELEAEDEQARLAAAKNVADGNWKTKKRGLDFDTSDNEDESQPKVGRKDRRRLRKIVAGIDGVETQPFEKSYQEGMDSDSDAEDDTLDTAGASALRDNSLSPSRQTAEQRNRQLRAVLARQRELSAEPVIVIDEDEVERPEFVITKSKASSVAKPSLPSSKSADRLRMFLKDDAEKGHSTRRANGQSSSVVTAPKTTAPLRGKERAKSNSGASMRSQSSISRLDRKGSGFL